MKREIKFQIQIPDIMGPNLLFISTVPDRGYKENGYIMRRVLNHPHSNKRGYIPEHRLLIEEKLGRLLIPRKELVHHINGVRDDNRLGNLKLSNPKDHASGHVGERNPNGRFACISPEFEQIKFRLYDSDRNLTQYYTLSELINKTYRKGKFEFRGRFTGLKDAKGKEIYEGDVLKVDKKFKHPKAPTAYHYVTFNEGSFLAIGWNSDIKITPHLRPYGLRSEIIGNIYENPELISHENNILLW